MPMCHCPKMVPWEMFNLIDDGFVLLRYLDILYYLVDLLLGL